MTFIPARRQYARYVCKLPCKVPAGGSALEGAILNIGMGGAYLSVRGTIKIQTVTMRVAFGEETFTVEARIVRKEGLDPREKDVSHYGVEFLKDTTTQGRLRLIVERVRVTGNGGAPATMTHYWR